jgi:hypothetical protein
MKFWYIALGRIFCNGGISAALRNMVVAAAREEPYAKASVH